MPDKPEQLEEKESVEKAVSELPSLAELVSGIRPKLEIKDEDRPKVEAAFGGKKIDENTITGFTYEEMIEAEKKEQGSLSVLFGKKADPVEGYKGMQLKEKYEAGDKILVNFQGNETAYWEIGAGDMLPENVREAKICDSQGNYRVGKRQGLKGGFYDSGGYIPVFDNYTVQVVEVWSDEKMKDERARLEAEEEQFYRDFEKQYGLKRDELKPQEMRQMETELNKLKDALEKRPTWRNYMKEAMGYFGVPPEAECLFWGVIRRESGFNPACKNPTSSATGLGQHLKGTWQDLHGYLTKNSGRGRAVRDGKAPLEWFKKYSAVTDTLEALGSNWDGEGVRAQIYSVVAYTKNAQISVNNRIEKEGGRIADHYKLRFENLSAADVTMWYIAHHEGPTGYATLAKWFTAAEKKGLGPLALFPDQSSFEAYALNSQKSRCASRAAEKGSNSPYREMNNVINYARKTALSAMSYKSFLKQ